MPVQPTQNDGIQQEMTDAGWEWTLHCLRCPTVSAVHAVRAGAICMGILEGWQVGWGEVLCPGCTLTHGQQIRKRAR